MSILTINSNFLKIIEKSEAPSWTGALWDTALQSYIIFQPEDAASPSHPSFFKPGHLACEAFS